MIIMATCFLMIKFRYRHHPGSDYELFHTFENVITLTCFISYLHRFLIEALKSKKCKYPVQERYLSTYKYVKLICNTNRFDTGRSIILLKQEGRKNFMKSTIQLIQNKKIYQKHDLLIFVKCHTLVQLLGLEFQL